MPLSLSLSTEARRGGGKAKERKQGLAHPRGQGTRAGAAEKWQGSKAMWSKGRVVVVWAAAKRGVWFVFCFVQVCVGL